MRKLLALVVAVLMCTALFAACSGSGDVNTDSDSAAGDSKNAAVGMFFDTFAEKLDTIASGDGAEVLGIGDSEDIKTLSSQAKDWESHMSGDTGTISGESGNVKVVATGTDSLQKAQVEWKMTEEALTGGNGDLVAFTIASAALIDAIGGDGVDGVEEVGNLVDQVDFTDTELSATTEPVKLGNGQFHVEADADAQTVSLIGEPTAD